VRILVLIGALALALLVPAQAGATTTIGTNLSRVPDDRMVDCTILPPYGVPTYQSTCTWYSTISTSENHIVPEGVGVITRARVRVGRTTGLMQFAVGRAQLDRNKPPGQRLLCCVWRAAGPPFTPAPNSITAVTLNEPVKYVRDFQSNQDLFDNLALSVLQPGVPIPAAPTLSGFGTTSTAGACWPAVQRGNAYCMPGGPGNYAVLFNADWDLNLSNSVRLAAQSAPVRNNAALVPLICKLVRECAGLLQIQNAKAPRAATTAARKTVTYGSARFRIPAGKTKTVKVTLGKAGRDLMRKRSKATVWANSIVGSGTARRVVSAKLTLTR
jgi:hypothetical protein